VKREPRYPMSNTVRCVLGCLLMTMVTTGCNQGNPTANTGAEVGQVVPPPRHAAMTPYTTLQSHPPLADWLNQKPGYKWAVVLQEGDKAYVGAFPQFTTDAPPGAAPKNPHDWPKTFDSPAELQRMSPSDVTRALDQTPPRADTYDNRPHSFSGKMSPQDQADIGKKIRSALPRVRTVLITTDVASAAILRGYANYVESGGDMTRYMASFHTRVSKIWPNGQGVGPNQPSASPNFGNLGAPADPRTPVRGHVHA
jgi:hypothetical protein